MKPSTDKSTTDQPAEIISEPSFSTLATAVDYLCIALICAFVIGLVIKAI